MHLIRLFSVLVAAALSTAPVLARTVPGWLVGFEHLLPQVSDESIDILRRSLPNSELSDGYDIVHKPLPATYGRAVTSIAKLGHEASKAMIWLYVEDPPRLSYRDDRVHFYKGEYLGFLMMDTDAAKWLVPIVRRRLDWADKHIQDQTVDQTWFSGPELGHIEGYLTVQGTDDDLRRVFRMEEAFRATPWGKTLYPVKEPPDKRWNIAMWRRESSLKRAAPYCDKFRRIISIPLLGLLQPPLTNRIASTNPTAAKGIPAENGNSKSASPTVAEELHPSPPWSVIAMVVVVACGLLAWLLKRRK